MLRLLSRTAPRRSDGVRSAMGGGRTLGGPERRRVIEKERGIRKTLWKSEQSLSGRKAWMAGYFRVASSRAGHFCACALR